MVQRFPDKKPSFTTDLPANDNIEMAKLTTAQVESIETSFEKDVQIADKDLDKWTMVRVQLREIGMHMANERDYQEFLTAVKKLMGKANLQTVGILLKSLVSRPAWAGSYGLMMEKLLADKPELDPKESAIRLSEIVRALDRDTINSTDEALIKIDLAKGQGVGAIDQLNMSLEEYEGEYARRFEGKFTREEFLNWLAEAARLGDMDLADEMETYLVNQFSVNGDKPEKAKKNIKETMDLLAKFKPSERSGYMRSLNESEQSYFSGGGKRPIDKSKLN